MFSNRFGYVAPPQSGTPVYLFPQERTPALRTASTPGDFVRPPKPDGETVVKRMLRGGGNAFDSVTCVDSDFRKVNFHVGLRPAEFKNCRFENCNFDRANLDDAVFKSCTFDERCTFRGASLSNVGCFRVFVLGTNGKKHLVAETLKAWDGRLAPFAWVANLLEGNAPEARRELHRPRYRSNEVNFFDQDAARLREALHRHSVAPTHRALTPPPVAASVTRNPAPPQLTAEQVMFWQAHCFAMMMLSRPA